MSSSDPRGDSSEVVSIPLESDLPSPETTMTRTSLRTTSSSKTPPSAAKVSQSIAFRTSGRLRITFARDPASSSLTVMVLSSK
jgi:hypothetical protein